VASLDSLYRAGGVVCGTINILLSKFRIVPTLQRKRCVLAPCCLAYQFVVVWSILLSSPYGTDGVVSDSLSGSSTRFKIVPSFDTADLYKLDAAWYSNHGSESKSLHTVLAGSSPTCYINCARILRGSYHLSTQQMCTSPILSVHVDSWYRTP